MTAKGTEVKSTTVRSNAKMLQREGRKILRKHEDRVGAEAAQEIRASLAAIDHLRGALDWKGLAEEIEKLDELLQRHASFARKSALREIIESVGFAVGLALVLRCCTYEPFNIPSISMMPTLRIGDYIFVNKFTHGIQVPFTNRIVAEDVLGTIERGEVVVFRFPADNSVDYIKRVIGIPGDVIRVQGQKMWIQKGGEGEFELIKRERLDRPCTESEDANKPLEGCVMYRETLDGRSYLIRLVHGSAALMGQHDVRTIKVPPRKYFVRGDNRQQSQDSLMWDQVADVAMIQKVLRQADFAEVFDDDSLELRAQMDPDLALDPHHAKMQVFAQKGGPATQHRLELWRDAAVPASAIYQGVRQAKKLEWKSSRVDKLLESASGLPQAQRNRVLDQGRKWDALAVAEQGSVLHALMRWDSQNLVVHYQCGKQLCPDFSKVAQGLAESVERTQKSPKARATELLKDPTVDGAAQFVRRTSSDPANLRRRYFRASYELGRNPTVGFRTEVFLKDHEGLDVIEASRFAASGISLAAAKRQSLGNGTLRFAKHSKGGFVGIWRPIGAAKSQAAVLLECTSALCKSQPDFFKRVQAMKDDLLAVAKGNLRPAAMLRTQGDLRLSSEASQPERYAWDSVQSVASMQGRRQALELELDWQGPADRAELLAKWRGPKAEGKEIESQLGSGAFIVDEPDLYRVGWVQSQSNTALLMQCGKDLCDVETKAIALANKISERASDADNFVARKVSIPQPFVPRGNIKGRSDIIWWPLGRFGQSMDVPGSGDSK